MDSLVLGGAGSGVQSGIEDRALLHGHAIDIEVSFNCFYNLILQKVLHVRMMERHDLGLIRNPIEDEGLPAKRRIVATSISASSIAG